MLVDESVQIKMVKHWRETKRHQ